MRTVSFTKSRARLALLWLVPAQLAAQAPETGVVAGRVRTRLGGEEPRVAAGARVSIVGSALSAATNGDGRFLMTRVPTGERTVRVQLLGYLTESVPVRVTVGDTARIDVTLEPGAQLLAALNVAARANETETFLSRPNIGTVTMSAAAMKGVPKIGEPDVVRLVQLMPGVVARNDFNTGLNVRGGEADQNLVLLDGHAIYNPFHLGGLFSTFMDATVGGMELVTGAFPARYGGRLSSVLDVRSAEETRPGIHATADLSVLAATARVAGAFGDGRGSWSAAARRTYADALADVFTRNSFPYHFRDFHAHATYALSPSVRLALTAYGGKDVLDANLAAFTSDSAPSRANGGTWAFDWGNQVVGLTLTKQLPAGVRVLGWRLGDGAVLEQRVSSSGFRTRLDLGDGSFSQRSQIRDLKASGSFAARGQVHEPSIGYEVAAHRIRYSSGSAQTGTSDFDLEQRPVTGALYVDDLWHLSSRWLVEGGVRAEALSGREWVGVSPRLSVKYFATPSFALSAGAGRVTQWMHSLAGDGALRYFDIWLASDPYIPVSTAWHWVVGAERRMRTGSVRIEGYVKHYDRALEANWSEDASRRGDEFTPVKGLSYGADVIARWASRRGASGWITYSYGLSSRWNDTVRWAPGHDRRHDLDLVATVPLRKYRLGARFGFATGSPFTRSTGEIVRRVYDPSLDRWGTGDPQLSLEPLSGVRNGARFPPTHRLDLDVSRDFLVRGATVSPYLSVVNAYNAKNVFVYLYDYSTDAPNRRAISQFPVLPSFGARVAF
jgi:hypothetical protein